MPRQTSMFALLVLGCSVFLVCGCGGSEPKEGTPPAKDVGDGTEKKKSPAKEVRAGPRTITVHVPGMTERLGLT
jgi:hypothetical protein